jgi:hypothetical protein
MRKTLFLQVLSLCIAGTLFGQERGDSLRSGGIDRSAGINRSAAVYTIKPSVDIPVLAGGVGEFEKKRSELA